MADIQITDGTIDEALITPIQVPAEQLINDSGF